MNQPRQVVFHRSANRPHLLLGCDRELALFSMFVCALVVFSLMSVWGVIAGALLWAAFMSILSRMAKSDPMLRQVYLRHIRYQAFYPAKSPKNAIADTTPVHWR
jgi:type IV secretion system protein VirB3